MLEIKEIDGCDFVDTQKITNWIPMVDETREVMSCCVRYRLKSTVSAPERICRYNQTGGRRSIFARKCPGTVPGK